MAIEKQVSNAEYMVLDWLWNQTETITSHEILEHFSATIGWKNATISTFLRRLVEKGYIQATRRGRTFIYTTCISRKEYEALRASSFLHTGYNGSLKNFVAAYATVPENRAEVAELREWFLKEFDGK